MYVVELCTTEKCKKLIFVGKRVRHTMNIFVILIAFAANQFFVLSLM